MLPSSRIVVEGTILRVTMMRQQQQNSIPPIQVGPENILKKKRRNEDETSTQQGLKHVECQGIMLPRKWPERDETRTYHPRKLKTDLKRGNRLFTKVPLWYHAPRSESFDASRRVHSLFIFPWRLHFNLAKQSRGGL